MTNVSERRMSDDLRRLTAALDGAGWSRAQGLLGGDYGYGSDYSNEVFEMHPYYWGECVCGFDERASAWEESHGHTDACYQTVIRARGFIDAFDDAAADLDWESRHEHNEAITDRTCAEMGLDPASGSYVHCNCERQALADAWYAENGHEKSCGVARPNFFHFASGVRVDWYKYIGRGMEASDVTAELWSSLIAECIASVATETASSAPPIA